MTQEVKIAECPACKRDVREPSTIVAFPGGSVVAHKRCRRRALALSGLAWLRGRRARA